MLSAEDKAKFTLSILTFAVFIWITVTGSMQGKILAVVLLALVLWSLYPRRHFLSSLFIIALLALFEASLSYQEFINSLFSTYGGSGLWIIISGFILSKGMESSTLARRIALKIAAGLGGDPNMVILSVALANLVIAPLSPSTTAKAFLLLPICIGLIQAFDSERGRSKFGSALMIMAMAANNICSTGFLSATVPNPISASYIREATNIALDWLNWLQMAMPLTLLTLIFSWLICRWMFKPEVKKTPNALKRIKDLSRELGPLSQDEMLITIILATSLLLWITESFHGLNSGLLSLALTLILFIPRIGVIKIGRFTKEVPWGSITLFAASMFLAKAVSRWSALDPVAQSIFNNLNLSSLPLTLFISLIIFVAMFLHVIFTSTTVYATVIIPLVISLAQLRGFQSQIIAIPVAFLTPMALILPINTIPNVVFYSTGYFKQKQMIAYGIITSLISALLILLIGIPYWRLQGLIPF